MFKSPVAQLLQARLEKALRRRREHPSRADLFMIPVLALALDACGGGGSQRPTPPPPPPPPPPAAATITAADEASVAENADGAEVTSVATENATSVTVDDDRFEVVGGQLKLKAGESFDFEAWDGSPIEVTITASGAGASAEHTVSVSITDVNESPSLSVMEGERVPGDAGALSSLTVMENMMGSQLPPLVKFEVMDPDEADEDILMGSMGRDAITLSDDRFEVIVDSEGGLWLALKSGASLDYEVDGSSVMVTVTFTDSAGNTAMATVEVMVTDGNDAPVFAQSSYSFDLHENADGSETAVMLGMVSATDQDSSDTHMFSITGGNESGNFMIDSATGALHYVGTGEDYRAQSMGPAYTLTVRVADSRGASAEATVEVMVLNVNEAPMFGQSSYSFDLMENADGSETAVMVGTVSAADPDEGDPVTYSITGGNEDGKFMIDSSTGAIHYVGMGEDRESDMSSYELTVMASDGSESSEVMVTISVMDVNDSMPMFVFGEDMSSYSFGLQENADGSETAVMVGMVMATDADGDSLTYSITGGNEDGKFMIDASTGALHYVGMGENYESSMRVHELTVMASDGEHEASALVRVMVGDVNEAPMVSGAVLEPFALVAGREGRMEVDLHSLFTDPDGDVMNFRLSGNAPEWLNFSVRLMGAGADRTVTGVLSGTPPAGRDLSARVSIVAADGDGLEGSAALDVVVDARNSAPTSIYLSVEQSSGAVIRTSSVTVDENVAGALLGAIVVTDADDPRHPHGQHKFTFMVGGKSDDRFEVVDGQLRLKDGVSLNHEDASRIALRITATDMAVGDEAMAGEEASVSTTVTINVRDVDAGDGPVAGKIGNWWVTLDEDLDAEDVREGDWLSFRLRLDGLDKMPAFVDEDGDTLTFSLSDDSPSWLQIDSKGRFTNKANMLAEAGVYEVTVIATDPAGNSARSTFRIAVAVSDSNDRDNDRPDIRDVIEYDYTEGTGARKVAEFTIRDKDLEIAPHPYGVLEVTMTGDYSDRFKLVMIGDEDNDPATVQYEIWTKSAAELSVDAMGRKLATPIEPIDFEVTEEVDLTIKVKDGKGLSDEQGREEDDREITIDIDDAADAKPMFDHTDISHSSKSRSAALRTTTLTVNQSETSKLVIVIPLEDVWSDADSDIDDLRFEVGGRAGLPSWVTVYGPDEWEDIEDRRSDVSSSDRPTGVRDGDRVVVLVVDRTDGEDGDNTRAGKALARFTLTARDDDGNAQTEVVSIDVKDANVDFTPAASKPVAIIGGDDPNTAGPAELTFKVDTSHDPDIAGGEEPVVVLYYFGSGKVSDRANGWSALTAAEVSSAIGLGGSYASYFTTTGPRTFQLDLNGDGTNSFLGKNLVFFARYFKLDPATQKVVSSKFFLTQTGVLKAGGGDGAVVVDLDLTTKAKSATEDVLNVGVAALGTTATTATVVLQASETGTSGWITVARKTVTLSSGKGDAEFEVTNDEGEAGNGGGLYYRAVFTGTDLPRTESGTIRLGDMTDPYPGDDDTDVLGPASPTEGDILRVKLLDWREAIAEVQWQVSDGRGGYVDIAGETGHTLTLTKAIVGAHVGQVKVRAKVTYRGQSDDSSTGVDESLFVTWLEYSAEIDLIASTERNSPPEVATVPTGGAHAIYVETQPVTAGGVQPAAIHRDMDILSNIFHDPDGDELVYQIRDVRGEGPDPALNLGLASEFWSSSATPAGRILAWVDQHGDFIGFAANNPSDVDAAADTTDAAGNYIVLIVRAADPYSDNGIASAVRGGDPSTYAQVEVNVHVNVAPTAIKLQSVHNGTNVGDKADLPASGTATALLVPDNTNKPDDADSNPDMLTFMDDESQAARKVADLDVIDQNLKTNRFGTHEIKLSGKGADQFEIRASDDSDGSTWELWLKKGATFDFEKLKSATDTGDSITLSITVTATDNMTGTAGRQLSAKGLFSVKVKNADTAADSAAPATPSTPDPTVPGLKDDSDDTDDDGPVVPPDTGMGPVGDLRDLALELDLLESFVSLLDDNIDAA